jgi:Spy/CpxP family protein refolding chaperone
MRTRKSSILWCGLTAAVLLFGSLALAKVNPNKTCSKDPNAVCKKAEKPAPGAWMKEKLGLTDEQVTKLQQLREANKDKMKAAGQAVQEKRKALQAAVDSGAGDDAIRAAAAALGTALGDSAVLRAANLAEVKKILTPDQYAKWQTAKTERAEKAEHRHGMRGYRGGHGRWGKGEGPEGGMQAMGPGGQWGPEGRHGRMGPPDPEKIFAMKDTNGDGKLSLEEFTANGRGNEEQFKNADTNGDGFVTLDEFKASIEKFMGRHHPQPQ